MPKISSAQRVDVLEVLRQKLAKKEKPKRPYKPSKRKMLGSYRLYKCEFCNITYCTNSVELDGNKHCSCGREMFRVLAPNLKWF